MTPSPRFARLPSRAVVRLAGREWRSFLQGLVTQDVESLAAGRLTFAALLTPQGRVLFDLFIAGQGDEGLIDCAAAHRDALLERLMIYRLRAKVEVTGDDRGVCALWDAVTPPPAWTADPRVPGLGFRGYGAAPPANATETDEAAYDTHRLALGVPGQNDWGVDKTYPIEANFDLLAGIDFKKGCFVGQETTSRMKRRGIIKNRMAPISFEGVTPPFGAELLAGDHRAGIVLTGSVGRAMALLRLDRLADGTLTLPDGRPWSPDLPAWITPNERDQ